MSWGWKSLFKGNIYVASPEIIVRRFTRIRPLTLKGKFRFIYFNPVPPNWRENVLPLMFAMSSSYPMLEEFKLKRMVVTKESFDFLSHSLTNFHVYSLSNCEGVITDVVAIIVRNSK